MYWFWYTWLNVGFNFFRINHIYFSVDYATMAYLLCWEYNTWLGEKVIYQCLDFGKSEAGVIVDLKAFCYVLKWSTHVILWFPV